MAIDIINSSNYINQSGINLSSQTSQSSQAAGAASYDGNGSTVTINARDLGLQTGQTFSGQVVSVDGNDIKLLLDNNQTINAKVDGNINAQLGQVISFEVKSTEGGQTALRPLYTNLATSLSVSNALSSAGLPELPQYTRMVSSMMDEGMNINKNALWDMSKEVATHPNADPQTIVQLTKLSLPITELNITQYENYKGFEHQIKDDVIGLSKGLTDLMDEVLKDANPELYEEAIKASAESPVAKVAGNILNSFLSALSGNKTPLDSNSVNNDPQNLVNNTQEQENKSEVQINDNGEVAVEQQPKEFDSAGLKIASQIMELIDFPAESTDDTVSNKLLNKANELVESLMSNEETAEAAETEEMDSSPQAAVTNENAQNKTITDDILKELLNNSLHISEGSKAEKLSSSEVLDFVNKITEQILNDNEKIGSNSKELLSKLLSDNDFKSIIQNTLSKQMLLKPENGLSNEKIQDLYDKIIRQSNAAMEIANNSGKEAPELMKSAQNLNDNVNFMNQLNQAVTYVQIPLMMNNKSAHGDLYVYTNKKNLKNNDGNLSALLHLDMDNLGPMDVYVALKNGTNVKTHFMLQDEATIDFLSQHIDKLNERLTSKGYSVATDITVKDKGKARTDITQEFMKESPDETMRMVSKFSFDVRA